MTELMVSLAVMIIVTSQIMLAYTNQHNASLSHERAVDSQEEVRLVTDVVLKDLRMAGFMVDATAAAGSIDGGSSAPDILCVSDPDAISSSVLTDATSRFDGASVTAAVGGNASSVTLSPLTRDIDQDSNDDFTSAKGILISSGTDVHCGEVTGTSGNTINFDPPTAAGFSASIAEAIVVPAVVYRVSGNTLTRNGTVLSTQIEDLQVEWGVDDDANGLIENAEFPIDDLSGENLNLLRTARVHLTAKVQRGEPGFSGQYTAVANRAVGPADTFKRRRVSADALLRNLR
jgi:Tfp pilus assembly protein PilW